MSTGLSTGLNTIEPDLGVMLVVAMAAVTSLGVATAASYIASSGLDISVRNHMILNYATYSIA